MLGFSKHKVADPHPYDAFAADLARVIGAARSRHLSLKTIGDTLQEHADSLKLQAAVNYAPTKIYSGNLPE